MMASFYCSNFSLSGIRVQFLGNTRHAFKCLFKSNNFDTALFSFFGIMHCKLKLILWLLFAEVFATIQSTHK